MSYPERRTLVSLITGAAIPAAYCIHASNLYQSGAPAGDLRFWAVRILIFIGIGIVASIIIQIIFHILLSVAISIREKIEDENRDEKQIEKSIKSEMVEDEMDRIIELKSMRFGFYFAGAGFIAALVALVLNYSPLVMLNILFISFSASTLLEGLASLYYYRRGV